MGTIIGAIGVKYIIDLFPHHRILAASNIFTLFSCLLFSSDLLTIQSLSVLLQVFFLTFSDPILNMIIMKFNDDPDKQFWLLMGHTMFGIGCLLGPIMVYCF